MLERFYRELLNFLHRQVNDRDTAADLAQESYARVLAAQHAGPPVLDGRALLYRTARNLVIDQHRRAQVRHHESLDTVAEAGDPPAPRYLQPEEALASRQTVGAYVQVIENLPPRCREAFVLHIIDGLPQAEIAQRMGISVSMVEKHVVRGTLACRRHAQASDGHPHAPAQRH
ncbi:RNA polymerase, sigma-24 subunit, ECF subfamily [Paracidovorax avenae ATCC 19860]|uniref:RNA polymerase, sigma-24 subunit, ECF subfamily n=1 Tax=Paracidovorax avenae (strain ATCC 19860 / DSM 7227 / CCUG 15838 / JCM 20985 / LMG 2117 / NCPPB 1011) TaxID=643561 RepID=F0Q6E5_PARA1|nr:sigma-70 family RNA polymerase sigma factor [Paracidovorax avenae]ADX45698.1 RNA polymerase, sigma-24 subunit, ECF subfamily [Paracidovorax avenae ATCC 19860]